jgi:two-component sensor histidine kinase
MVHDEFLKTDAFLTREILGIALESAGIAVWTLDPALSGVQLSSAMTRLLDLPPGQTVAYDEFLALQHPDDREKFRAAIAAALNPDGSGLCEVEVRFSVGVGAPAKPRWFAAQGRALFVGDGAGRQAGLLVGTLRDITERKDAEQSLKTATEEQGERLHEVNHRVKNSLQLISSLLRLQARGAADLETRRQLDDATTRISTIAHIHDRLYRDQDIKRIRFGTFVTELCSDLQGSAPRCSLQVVAPEFLVAIDKAIPLALVINELVTNAFKYAYPGAGGPVTVTVAAPTTDQVTVTVGDLGTGLPDGFSVEKAKTLGMILIAGMVQQLKGRLEVRNGAPGVTFAITASVGDIA